MKIGLPTKPQFGATVNWAHPLAQGLVLCYIYNERGTFVANQSAGSNPHNLAVCTWDTPTGGDCQLVGSTWADAFGGLGVKCPASGGGGIAPLGIGSTIGANSDFSILHIQTLDGAGFGWCILNFDNIGNNNNVGLAITGTNTVALVSGAGGARNIQLQTVGTLAVDGKVHTLIATRKVGSALNIWVDGTNTNGADGTFLTTAGFKWVNEVSSSSGPGGTVIADYVWDRCISADDAALLNADPYLFFAPISPILKLWYPFISTPLSASAADTLTFSDSVIAQLIAPINIAIFDSFALTDTVGQPGAGVARTATDFLSLTDATKLLMNLQLNIGDNITLVDLVQLIMTLNGVSVSDVLTLSDSVLVQVAGVINVSVSDTLAFNDAVAILTSTTFNAYIRRYLNDVV